jgi:sugar O-acyltransferase (sialic acid O-acetyltransferase NeuD family)
MTNGYILGSGAQGRVALEILRLQYQNYKWYFIDDEEANHKKIINGTEVIGGIDKLLNEKKPHVHIAIGKPSSKEKILVNCSQFDLEYISAIHPTAVIAQSSKIGKGVMIGACSVVNSNAVIGDHALINTNAIIEHDTIVEDNSNISPCVCVGGRVHIKRNVFVGSGAKILARTIVGADSIIGMGAVVIRDVPEKTLAFGVPARNIKSIDQNFDWSNVL